MLGEEYKWKQPIEYYMSLHKSQQPKAKFYRNELGSRQIRLASSDKYVGAIVTETSVI
jgi:hypothetical protein